LKPLNQSLPELRQEYTLGALDEIDLHPDPLQQFGKWFQQAAEKKGGGSRFRAFGIGIYKAFKSLLGEKPIDPNAMALATAGKDGRPSLRTVLLKGVDDRGFIFFTNYESRKGRELAENPNAAILLHWAELERQVCVTGTVSKLAREEAETYFQSRPRGSRLAAWVSRQSRVVADRHFLEQLMRDVAAQYPGESVPMPEYWGGYVLHPEQIEFWQGRRSRLHDRLRYTRQPDGKWVIERLAP
jgi:pyridoxamine 5'-phosphate oxidase